MRATPICHRTIGPRPLLNSIPQGEYASYPEHEDCIGARCSMWHARNDNTPAQNLGCCAENKTAVPWADPAVKESK